MTLRTAFSSLLALCLMAGSAFASSFGTTYGFSPRGMAMGNAMSAHVNTWDAVYYNVAGLGKTRHLVFDSRGKSGINQISINYLHTRPDFDLNINRVDPNTGKSLSTKAAEDLSFGTVVLGMAMDLNTIYAMPDLISSARFGISMGINDDLTAVKINDTDPRTHNFLRYGKEAQRAMILAGTGFGFCDDLFGLGVGMNISFGGSGTIAVSDVIITEEPQEPIDNATMEITLDPTLVAGFYLSPGKAVQALEGLGIGLSWRQKSKLEIAPLQTVATMDTGNVLLNLRLALLDYFQPDIYTLGIAYAFTQRFLASIEVERQMWSGFEASANHQTNFGDELPELEDIFVAKLGLEYKLTRRLALQGGYCYEPSFVPDEGTTGTVNYLDNDKHILSLGTSYRLRGFGRMKRDIDLFASYQHQILVNREVVKDDPTAYNPDYDYEGSCSTLFVGFTINM